jgi:hypothetical protein
MHGLPRRGQSAFAEARADISFSKLTAFAPKKLKMVRHSAQNEKFSPFQ